ncbi:MAG TPA: hypothetical protein VK209_09825 [Candidatus Sulfotelmatobacter sp.]|nr:hypothetical protein [Candidatus Sulfotelmatobacter sp.]
MVRKTIERESHDESVQTIANELKRDNWNVKANLEGNEKPSKINGFLPDIEATKGGLKRICQVLTEKDFKGNKSEYIDFKHYCEEYDFHLFVVDQNGNRREIDPRTLEKKR